MLTDELLALDPQRYKAATEHRFLRLIGTLSIRPTDLCAWIVQDRFYTNGYTRMLGAMLSRLALFEDQRLWSDQRQQWDPEHAQRTLELLTEALVSIVKEKHFFTRLLVRYGSTSHASQPMQPLVARYIDFQQKTVYEGGADLAEALVLLWAMNQVFFDAWSYARSILQNHPLTANDDAHVKTIRDLVSQWTEDEAKAFVDQCADLVNAIDVSNPRRLAVLKSVFLEMLDIEVLFWDLAFVE